jgi:hypothetical protein
MSSCSTTSPCTNSPRCGRPSNKTGAGLLFLPPYSPDFNPIEMAFAKRKAFLRAARPRTFDDVCALIQTALALFLPDECANYVTDCAYPLTTSHPKTL